MDSEILNLLNMLKGGTNEIDNLYHQLNQQELPANVTIEKSNGFRSKLYCNFAGSTKRLSIILISKDCFETALYQFDDLIYDSKLGYDDIKRFYSVDELVDEIKNIANLINSPTNS